MERHATAAAPSNTSVATDLDHQAILSPKQTYKLTSLSGATIWRLRQRKQFPDPVQLSPGRMGWRRRDIEQWLAARQDIADYLRPSPNPLARQAKATPSSAPPSGTKRRRARKAHHVD